MTIGRTFHLLIWPSFRSPLSNQILNLFLRKFYHSFSFSEAQVFYIFIYRSEGAFLNWRRSEMLSLYFGVHLPNYTASHANYGPSGRAV